MGNHKSVADKVALNEAFRSLAQPGWYDDADCGYEKIHDSSGRLIAYHNSYGAWAEIFYDIHFGVGEDAVGRTPWSWK